MYATCLHCARPLGGNEAIEALPIGRRVAFDAAKGRLWVVCRSCERWNLTPFDSRWEAIEQAERLFRDTRVRVSTDNIGLARMPDGMDLVRIGAPKRPEFAAWRYGDQFGRRRRKVMLYSAAGVAGVGALATGMWAAGIGAAAVMPVFHIFNIAAIVRANHVASGKRFAHPEFGTFVPIGNPKILSSERPEGWAVEVGYTHAGPDPKHLPMRSILDVMRRVPRNTDVRFTVLHGHDALPYLRFALPRVNMGGAKPTLVQESVRLIEKAGGPENYGRWAAGKRREWGAKQAWGDTGDLTAIPPAARLAFEMALHEDSERAALEGELSELERAWAEAEGVAAIADSLMIPPQVESRLTELKADRDNATDAT
ncbi:MAG: hypothetical protein IBJ03_03725 [Gemmatimonadaceae bacterium]|nr:hypothetical protein [Gemmatimonadaceae bacterium]